MGIPELKEMFAVMIEEPAAFFLTLIQGVSLVIIITLMAWAVITWEKVPPQPFLEADKGEVIRLTPNAMAESTYLFNESMKMRAK